MNLMKNVFSNLNVMMYLIGNLKACSTGKFYRRRKNKPSNESITQSNVFLTLTREGRIAELLKLDSFWNLSSKPAVSKKIQDQ